MRRLPQRRKRPYHSVRVSLPGKMKRVVTMVKVLQTYLTENDFLSRLRRLETRGCSFVPMTTDEITLAEHLCNKGVLHQDGSGVRLAPCPQPLIPTRYA